MVPMTEDPAAMIAEADRAAAKGDAAGAAALLDRVVTTQPEDIESWLKLAAMRRVQGQPREALAATERALAAAPLHFTALLLRANLLDRLGDPEAGEAYTRALAQKPDSVLPAPMVAAVSHAEVMAAAHAAQREAKLERVTASIDLDADEQRRVARFRSNVLRTTRTYHSEPTHFQYPGLREREFHDRASFPWLAEIERHTDMIRAEMLALIEQERAEIVPYIRYAEHEPLAQWKALNHSRDWSVVHLLQNGRPIERNARQCPGTMALLATIGQPEIARCSPNAMFSLLAPHTTIPPHTGVANTRLVCHLPLVVPEGCWFRVGAETRFWREGEAFVFDDTIEHEACNPSDVLRVVLIFDVWHPDLSVDERAAVAGIMATDMGGSTGGL